MEPPKLYPGMVQLYGNLMCAVDLETTGVRPGFNEIIQIAVLPLDANLKPLNEVRPFYTLVKPNHPERASLGATAKHRLQINDLLLNAPEPDKVADWLVEWFESLKLPVNKFLVPLAHNWSFESAFLREWLGGSLMDQLFHCHSRDSMLLAIALNDRAAFSGEETLFYSVSLSHLCKKLNITNLNPHDALSDCLAEAELYRTLLQLSL